MNRMFCALILMAIITAPTNLEGRGTVSAERPRLKSIYCEEHSLEEMCDADTQYLVLVFMGVDCPVVRQYIPRLNELHQEFSKQGVRFLGIYSNAGEHVLAMAHHAEHNDIAFPVLLDCGHVLADQVQAEMMSEVVVVDRQLKKNYQGAIDNQFKKRGRLNQASEHYLADALTQLLGDEPVIREFMPASGCRIERNDPIQADQNLSFYKDVAPLIQQHCQTCHRKGEVGPFELFTYDDVVNHAETIEEVVLDRRMPPWHGILDKKFGKLRNDKRLSDDEVRTIVAWIRAEMPKGDPQQAPRPVKWPSPDAWAIGKPDFVYQMAKPFSVPAAGIINYQFFRVPLNLQADRWVQAIQVRPGNREVVHHIGLHLAPAGTEDFSGFAMAALFGLSGDRTQPLNDYVPGDLCNHKEYPPDRAVRIPKNSDLIFEVHYTPNGKQTVDQSKVAIRWALTPPSDEVFTKVFRKRRGGFTIPAHDPHVRMEDTYYFEKDVLIDSVRPHMHLRGQSYRLELVERDPATDEVTQRETILSVPNFDANWQRTYEFETPLPLAAGTELVATVYFDNSKLNPNNPDPSANVYWGLQSTDEMMSTRFQYRLPK
jgi:hypothetical protein